MFLLQKGMSQAQVGFLETSLFWSIFLLEIPTGMLGDKVGRKWSNFIGMLILFISTMGMVFADNFGFFFILFVLEGMSAAFRSGSDAAFLYDSLRMLKREGEYLHINAKIRGMSSVVLGIAMGLGGIVQSYGWNVVYLAYAVAVLISTICILLTHEEMKDIEFLDAENTEVPHGDIIPAFKHFITSQKNRNLVFFMFIVCLVEAIVLPYFVLGQSMFEEFGFSEAKIGMIYCIIEIAAGVVYLFARKVSKLISFHTLIVSMMVFYIVFMFLNVFQNQFISCWAFYISMVFPDVGDIIIQNYIQEKIPSKIRASILSVMSLFQSAMVGSGFIVYGVLFTAIGILPTYALAGFMPLLCLILFLAYFKRVGE